MAVAPIHGKGVRTLVDEKDLSDFLKEVTVSAEMDTAEVTTFGDNDKSYIPGLKDATLSFNGLFAASTTAVDDVANYLDGALGGSTKQVITVDVNRSTGGRAWMMQADDTKYDVSAPVDDIVTISVDARASGGYWGGRMLRPLSTKAGSTATVSGSAVATPGTTAVGGTTGGGVAHFHLTAVQSTGEIYFTVQHSTTGSTWATLITSSTFSAVNFQRSTVAGTVKEQLRGQVLAGSTKDVTATAAIAFSRRVRT